MRTSAGVHPSRQDLDIEEPPGGKGLVEEGLDLRGSPEDVSNLWICYPLEVRENYQHE